MQSYADSSAAGDCLYCDGICLSWAFASFLFLIKIDQVRIKLLLLFNCFFLFSPYLPWIWLFILSRLWNFVSVVIGNLLLLLPSMWLFILWRWNFVSVGCWKLTIIVYICLSRNGDNSKGDTVLVLFMIRCFSDLFSFV